MSALACGGAGEAHGLWGGVPLGVAVHQVSGGRSGARRVAGGYGSAHGLVLGWVYMCTFELHIGACIQTCSVDTVFSPC